MDRNLKYGIIESLMLIDKLELIDKKEFFRKYLNKEYNFTALYNSEPIEEIEDYLLKLRIPKEDYESLEDLYITPMSSTIHFIWNDWDGTDEYFSVDSFEEIDLCPNLKKIDIFNMCSAVDLSPLASLKKLEELIIEFYYEADPIITLEPLLHIPKLKKINFTNFAIQNSEEDIIKELKKKVKSVNIEYKE